MPATTARADGRTPGRAGALAVFALFLVAGCGSDGGGGPAEPDGILIHLSAPTVQITGSVTMEAVLTYPFARADDPACDWFVNGVWGGEAATGTITQTNPATFTAPSSIPAGGEVEIMAVSRSNSAFTSTDTLRVVFTRRYVDADLGADEPGGGMWAAPWKTVSYALGEADAGDTVVVLPGTYGSDHGEGASYSVPEDVALIGSSRDSCRLLGAGDQFFVVLLGGGATFGSFTLSNSGNEGIGVLSQAGGYIRDIAVDEIFDYSVIRADGGSYRDGNDVVIEDCVLVNSSAPGTEQALELVYDTHCTVRNCTVSGWSNGLYVNRDSDPLIEGCVITDNGFGVVAAGGNDPLKQPDLGGGSRGSAGGNTITGNGVGVLNNTATDIWALYNTWNTNPPTEPADFLNTGGGSVIWSR